MLPLQILVLEILARSGLQRRSVNHLNHQDAVRAHERRPDIGVGKVAAKRNRHQLAADFGRANVASIFNLNHDPNEPTVDNSNVHATESCA